MTSSDTTSQGAEAREDGFDNRHAVAVGRLRWAANTHPDAAKKALLTEWADECEDALDRPTAPSASGGEAVAWRYRRRDLHGSPGAWQVSKDPWPGGSDEDWEVQNLFAHPARMPTREAMIEAVLYSAREDGNDSPVDYGDAEGIVNAILALFHTGETKGDGRG